MLPKIDEEKMARRGERGEVNRNGSGEKIANAIKTKNLSN